MGAALAERRSQMSADDVDAERALVAGSAVAATDAFG